MIQQIHIVGVPRSTNWKLQVGVALPEEIICLKKEK